MKNNDTYSYKGWLLSDKLWKRSLAVVGHYIIGYVIVFLVVLIFIGILTIIGSIMGW